jgi:hypothetical protein
MYMMESRVEKYRNVHAEIIRLTAILITQYWMHGDQAREEAIKTEARTRRYYARSQLDYDWYSWIKDIGHFPYE